MVKKLLYFVAGVLFLMVIYLGIEFYTFSQHRHQLVQEKGKETTEALRNQVDAILSKIVVEAERLANLFGSNEYSAEEIQNIIRKSSLSIPEIQGVTACFEPYGFSKKQRLFCPYYNKGSQSYVMVEESYDYSKIGKGTAWYTGVRDEGAKWVEPYFATAAQDWYVDYGIPFYYNSGPNKGKVRGTITMSFIASGFKKMIHSLSIGKTGYGIITSTEGTFLSHPIGEYVGKVNLDSVMQKEPQKELVEIYQKISAGEVGTKEFYNKELNDKAIFFFDKIPTSNWGIGLLFFEEDLLGDNQALSRRYIRIAILLSLFFICLLAIYYNKDYLNENEIWSLSLVSSLLLIGNIFLLGYLQHSNLTSNNSEKSPPIIDLISLESFVDQQKERAEKLKITPKRTVPTGIFIQRMEFEDSYNLNVGGTIWQKYPLDIAEEVNMGFTFPQMSPFAEASYIEESYRKKIASKEGVIGYLLVGWEFRVTLRLNLQYADFPFDKRHINIEIQPLNNNDHLLFTPDLASYSFTNPTQKSGLNKNIQISGSVVLQSYFNYSLESYNTSFGYGDQSLFEEVPVLHYHIYLKRKLLNAFVTYLIPIFVTLIMVFILINACSKTEERQGIIESMAAFFFVLIFSHIDLRKEIETADLIYMEYFYFISYTMMILATFNLITYTKAKSKIFDFNENQIFKAIFFPFFFLLLLIVTLLKFY